MLERRDHGFTLIELAIVTAIIGLLAAGAVASFGAIRINTKIKETNRNLHSAELLLQAFVARNGRLPCPADPRLPVADPNYAREAAGAAVIDNECAATQRINRIYWGSLPALDLGVAPRAITDGWDRQFYYLVVGRPTLPDSLTNGVWSLDDGQREIELWDKADGDASLPARRQIVNQGVYALISGGPNGNGVYTLEGRQMAAPPPTALAENDNQDADIFLVSADYSESATVPFDDIVVVRTEDDIVMPLAEMGEVSTKTALTLTRIRYLEDLIMGFAAQQTRDPDGAGPRTVSRHIPLSDTDNDGIGDSTGLGTFPFQDFNLPQADIQDAWGAPIIYNPRGPPATIGGADAGIWSGSSINLTPASMAFFLRSSGPDTVDNGGLGDDIDLSDTFSAAIGLLTRAGLTTD